MMGVAIELKCIVETNQIRVCYCCVSSYFHYKIPFKWLYTSSKTEHFSYKGGNRVRGRRHIKVYKRRAGLEKWYKVVKLLRKLNQFSGTKIIAILQTTGPTFIFGWKVHIWRVLNM